MGIGHSWRQGIVVDGAKIGKESKLDIPEQTDIDLLFHLDGWWILKIGITMF